MLVMSVFLTLFAAVRSDAWTVNPSEYRYDMSLYFRLSSKDYEDLDAYQIGAFINDECRGLAEKVDLPDGSSCMLLRIRSNSTEPQEVVFKMLDRATDAVVILKGPDGEAFTFKADQMVGLPSAPYVLTPYFNVSVKAGAHGTIDFEDGMYAEGTVLKLTAVPDEGYHFESWSDGSTEAEISITVNSDIELSATFAVSSFTITFVVDGETIESTELDYGTKITAPTVPAREGYTFSGWDNLPSTMPAEDIVVEGSYKVNIYKATFMIDGKTVATLEVAYGDEVPEPEGVTEKEGYTFSGWENLPEIMPAGNIVVTGSFSINSYEAVFKLDGKVFETQTIEYNASVTAPEAPEKEGYTFAGWEEYPGRMPAHDIVVEGTYTVNSYEVLFLIDGVEFQTMSVDYGTVIDLPEPPAIEGHTFAGWQNVPETMPAHDIELEGTYDVNTYKATFILDGKVFETVSIDYGTAIKTPQVPDKEGYVFDGWQDVPETMPAHDIEINGTYSVKKYNAVFMIDGEVFETLHLVYGEAIKAPEAPEKEGYTFSGWQNLPASMPARDIEINGTYTINSYKAVFKIDGEVFETLTLEYGAAVKAPEAPEKEGYTFSGWGEVPATMPARDIEFNGIYTINSYTAVFKLDGEVFETQTLEYGAAVKAPEVPEKEGYTFSGWDNVPATMPAHDIEVNGTYVMNGYTATFILDGEVFKTITVEYGAVIELPEAPEKEGYTFGGWQNVPETMPARDIEIKGSYTVNSYTVTFILEGKVFETVTIEYGAPVRTPEVPDKEGYSFAGWQDAPATMPARDIEINGSYEVNSYTATFMIDGEVFETISVKYGAAIEGPEAPEKEGYTFAGWENVPASMPARNIEINGTYTINSYSAIFIIDGEIIATIIVEYGAVINAPAAPEKEDYRFDGWQDVPETMPAQDIVITGSYTYSVTSFNAVFMIGEETIATIIVEAGDPIVAPEAPEKEGYTFDGWQDIPEVMPAHDIVIGGSYTVNSYTATFLIDGETIDTISVEYGAVINAPAAPEKEDYRFEGWQNVPETMPAHDIVIEGSYVYSPDLFNVVFMIDGETIETIIVEAGDPIVAPEAPEREGYTFGGWQDIPEVMPNHDVVINGSYTANTYEVIFIVNGETVETATVEYGATVVAPEMSEREGYTFSGWLNLPETMPAQSIEVVGNYHANYYTATFIIDGEVFETVSIEYGSVISVPVAPEKEDHTFDGWQNLPETMPAHDIEVTGSYTYSPDIFKAVFMIDGEIFETIELEPGDAINAPAAPEREGHSFSGWQDMPEVMPNHDVVISGSYTVNSYTATFVIDGETVDSMSVEYGAVINVPAAPEKEDYRFDGWQDVPATMPARDIVIEGSYTYSPDLFNAVFMIDGETIATITVEAGEPVILPAEPYREGHTFAGWQDVPEVMPNHDITVNGSFTLNSYTVVFMVDDEIFDSRRADFGSVIEAPEAPERDGYTFAGWNGLPATMPATDLVVSALYDPALYRLLIYLDGEVYMDEQLAFGMEIVVPEPEVPEGYVFDGWDIEIPATMPPHNLVIYGTLSIAPSTWIGALATDGKDSFTIYDLNGALLFKDAKAAEVKDQLTPGVYIINGHKVMVK